MPYLQRELEKLVPKIAKDYKVIAIIGPRQSGKTTLVKHIFKHYKYYNLENIETLEILQDDPLSILSADNLPIIIDEAQKAPNIFSQIQILADSIEQNGQIILTGSSNLLLQKNLSQSLAGRVAILNLFPLSYGELIQNNIQTNPLTQIIFTGFYPALYKLYTTHFTEHSARSDHALSGEDESKITRYYKNYTNTYLKRDILDILKVKDSVTFFKFLKLLAYSAGQLVKLTELANAIDKTHTTLKNWVTNLQITYITFELQPYYRNFGKRIIKTPKVYFYDTGLLSYLAGITTSKDLYLHPLYGQLFENFVIADYIKTAYHNDIEPNAYFWRTASAVEIDLLIERGQKIHAIEIKANKTFKAKFLKNLNYIKSLPNTSGQIETYLVYGGDSTFSASGHHIYSVKDIHKLWDKILKG